MTRDTLAGTQVQLIFCCATFSLRFRWPRFGWHWLKHLKTYEAACWFPQRHAIMSSQCNFLCRVGRRTAFAGITRRTWCTTEIRSPPHTSCKTHKAQSQFIWHISHIFYFQGKQQRDRRKLREKRRSTGVVHLARYFSFPVYMTRYFVGYSVS